MKKEKQIEFGVKPKRSSETTTIPSDSEKKDKSENFLAVFTQLDGFVLSHKFFGLFGLDFFDNCLRGAGVGVKDRKNFILEYIRHIQQKVSSFRDVDQQDRAREYVERVRSAFFSSSPDITGGVDVEGIFDMATLCTRDIVLQGHIGAALIHNLSYICSFGGPNILDGVVKQIGEKSTAEQLDALDVLSTVGVNSVADGEWAENGFARIKRAVSFFEKSPIPFVKALALSCVDRLQREYMNPSKGLVRTIGDRTDGRMRGDVSFKDDNLQYIYAPSAPISYMGVQRVSSDYIAFVDQQGRPSFLAGVSEQEQQNLSVDISAIRREEFATDCLREFGYISKLSHTHVAKRCKEILVLAKEVGKKDIFPEHFSFALERISHAWDVLSKFRSDYFHAAEESNVLYSRIAVNRVRDLLNSLLKEDLNFQSEADMLEECIQNGDEDRAFGTCERIARMCEFNDNSPVKKEIAGVMHEVCEKHQMSFVAAQQSCENKMSEFEKEYGPDLEVLDSTITKLKTDPLFREDVIDFLRDVQKQYGQKKISVSVDAVEDLFLDPTITPFDDDLSAKDAALLFFHLHSPVQKEFLERELRVDISSFPIREQVGLLRYLATPDSGQFDDIRKVLSRQGVNSGEFISLFLSAGDMRGALRVEDVIEWAKEASVEEINMCASRVSKTLSSLRDLEEILREISGDRQVDTRRVVQGMVQYVGEAVKKYIEGNTPPFLWERMQDDALIFCGVCAQLFREKKVDLKEMQGMSLERVWGKDLSPEDAKDLKQIALLNFELGETKARALYEGIAGVIDARDPNVEFVIARKKAKKRSEIVSFCRFNAKESDGRRYWGSFNVNPKFRGSGIGDRMLYDVVQKEAERQPIYATVFSQLSVGMHYVNKDGFCIIGLKENFHNTGETHFIIECAPKRNDALKTKDSDILSDEKIRSLWMGNDISIENARSGASMVVCRFHTKQDVAQMTALVKKFMADGFLGTRYVEDPEDASFRFFVFERFPSLSKSLVESIVPIKKRKFHGEAHISAGPL